MFRKLRLHFSLLVTGITFFVLFAIVIIMNVTIYCNVSNHLYTKARIAYTRPLLTKEKAADTQTDNPEKNRMLPRYFFIEKNGDTYTLTDDQVYGVGITDCNTVGQEVFSKKDDHGFYMSYYYYRRNNKAVFLDAASEQETIHSTLVLSSSVSASAFFLISASGFLLARKVIQPYEKLYQSQRRFLTDASHELKTPLAIISANLEILDKEEEVENKWIQSSIAQTDKMRGLVNELVLLNKIEESDGHPEMEEFDIGTALLEASDSFASLAIEKNVTFNTDIKEGVSLKANENMILKLIGILLDNAFKYVNKDGFVTISLKEEKKKLTLTFQNSAEKIDKIKMSHCFERFYTVDESHSHHASGYGIGLSIAQAIVNENNGTISCLADDIKNEVSFVITFKK